MDDPEVTVNTASSFLFGFEADIVMTVNGVVDGRRTSSILNVEVDGPSHSRVTVDACKSYAMRTYATTVCASSDGTS